MNQIGEISMSLEGKDVKYSLVFAALLVIGIVGLNTIPADVSRESLQTDAIDGVTISYNLYQPTTVTHPVPVVIMGHGICVNKEMMTSFAVEIAAHKYVVASVDWRGHGESTGTLTTDGLYRDLEAVVVDIPLHAAADMDRIALLGYSMGGSPTFRYAVDHPTAKAWVGVGTIADGEISDRSTPKNVLMIIAKYDEAFSPEQARIPMVNLTGVQLDDIEYEKLYGKISNGTARKIHIVPGADHLTTPWNSDFVSYATSWIAQTFGGEVDSLKTFYQRVILLFIGLVGLMGFLFALSVFLARTFKIPEPSDSLLIVRNAEPLSVARFIGQYYFVTICLIPAMILFAPLIFTPLPFTALLTVLTGGLGINLLIYCCLLARRQKVSITRIMRKNLCGNTRIWMFSIVLTAVFVICYYFLVGLHFLGMIPSAPKMPYLLLYSTILFGTFFFYSLFIQKLSLPFFEDKLGSRSRTVGATVLSGITDFALIYSWFSIVILIPCYVIDNYFFAMILILMFPIFLFMTVFSVSMERVTGSVVPNAVLQSVWLGLVITTVTPYVSGLNLMG
jgi:hypothetical protein